MPSGLHAPLSPHEEILLRRVAFESPGVEIKQLKRLVDLALVDCTGRCVRLTALGRRRFEALPKAPLLATRRMPVGLVVEATLAKFDRPVAPASVVKATEAPPAAGGVMPIHFDLHQWRARAEERLIVIRSQLIEHRKRHVALLESSRECIATSRALLLSTMLQRSASS